MTCKQSTQIDPAFDCSRPNGRASGGFSLRRALIEQGVKTEFGIRAHLSFVAGTLGVVALDIARYRVNPNNPDALPLMG